MISGIGFIGAGTIIVTKRQRVKGLTTASGLWTVAIVGLAIGAGFYEGAVYASVGIFLAESIFTRVGHYVQKYSPETMCIWSIRTEVSEACVAGISGKIT